MLRECRDISYLQFHKSSPISIVQLCLEYAKIYPSATTMMHLRIRNILRSPSKIV